MIQFTAHFKHAQGAHHLFRINLIFNGKPVVSFISDMSEISCADRKLRLFQMESKEYFSWFGKNTLLFTNDEVGRVPPFDHQQSLESFSKQLIEGIFIIPDDN